MALLCLHLYHGVWSMFQSAGHQPSALHALAQEIRGRAARWWIAIGNFSIPIAALAGLLKY